MRKNPEGSKTGEIRKMKNKWKNENAEVEEWDSNGRVKDYLSNTECRVDFGTKRRTLQLIERVWNNWRIHQKIALTLSLFRIIQLGQQQKNNNKKWNKFSGIFSILRFLAQFIFQTHFADASSAFLPCLLRIFIYQIGYNVSSSVLESHLFRFANCFSIRVFQVWREKKKKKDK